jgi:hypothetical protein
MPGFEINLYSKEIVEAILPYVVITVLALLPILSFNPIKALFQRGN